jgi:hypothetical protein
LDEPTLDLLPFIRDLLPVLRENDVHSFQTAPDGSVTVVFNEKEAYVPRGTASVVQTAIAEDDGHSTSPKRVEGFGFKNKALWQWQNGKVLKLDGSLE